MREQSGKNIKPTTGSCPTIKTQSFRNYARLFVRSFVCLLADCSSSYLTTKDFNSFFTFHTLPPLYSNKLTRKMLANTYGLLHHCVIISCSPTQCFLYRPPCCVVWLRKDAPVYGHDHRVTALRHFVLSVSTISRNIALFCFLFCSH